MTAGVGAIVVGGGVNGLVAAAALAKRHRVIMLERRDQLGGLAAGAEFHPGFRHQGILHDADRVSPTVVKALGLPVQWRDPAPVFAVGGGRVAEVPRTGPFFAFLDRIRPLVRQVVESPAPDVGDEASLWPLLQRAWGFRRLGRRVAAELLQVGPSAVDDLLGEHVDDPLVRAALIAPGLLGTWMGPRSPTSAATWLLNELTRGREVVGGPAALVEALASRVDARLGAEVTKIRVEGGAVRGVIANGEAIDAAIVVSAVGPRRTLLDLVEPGVVDPLIERDVADVRVRGIFAKVHLALSGPLDAPGEHFRTGAHPDDLERAFDDAKHRRLPTRPPLDVRILGNVASIQVHGVPFDLRGGWTDAARDALGEAVLASLEAVGVRDRVVGMEVLTPADLAERFGLEGGHVFHGEQALDQLWVMRPTAALARHAVPGISGLYLGCAGTHPGGGVTGLPGWLAAKAALS